MAFSLYYLYVPSPNQNSVSKRIRSKSNKPRFSLFGLCFRLESVPKWQKLSYNGFNIVTKRLYFTWDRRNEVWRVRDAKRSLICFAPHLKEMAEACYGELRATTDLTTERAIIERYKALKATMPKRALAIVGAEQLELKNAYDACSRIPILLDQLVTCRLRVQRAERLASTERTAYRETLSYLTQVLRYVGGDDLVAAMNGRL